VVTKVKFTKIAKTTLKTYSKKRFSAQSLERRVIPEPVPQPHLPEVDDGEDERSQVLTLERPKERVSEAAKPKGKALKALVSKRAAKKDPRTLPVNELQCIPERVDDPEPSLRVDNGTVFGYTCWASAGLVYCSGASGIIR
jgi:hypothetical protein